MTVRFAESGTFDVVAKETSAAEKPDPTAVFVRLLEQQVDHLADLLEFAGRDLDDASHIDLSAGSQEVVAPKCAAALVDDQYRPQLRRVATRRPPRSKIFSGLSLHGLD
jgi:hypothetical protein